MYSMGIVLSWHSQGEVEVQSCTNYFQGGGGCMGVFTFIWGGGWYRYIRGGCNLCPLFTVKMSRSYSTT